MTQYVHVMLKLCLVVYYGENTRNTKVTFVQAPVCLSHSWSLQYVEHVVQLPSVCL